VPQNTIKVFKNEVKMPFWKGTIYHDENIEQQELYKSCIQQKASACSAPFKAYEYLRIFIR
jgi:hypothetical protein